MIEVVLLSEALELSTCVLRTTVRQKLIWNPMSCHMRLQFPDDSRNLQVIQPVDLEETGEIIYGQNVILVVQVEQVGGNFGTRAIWNFMTDERLLLLSCAVGRTRFAL